MPAAGAVHLIKSRARNHLYRTQLVLPRCRNRRRLSRSRGLKI